MTRPEAQAVFNALDKYQVFAVGGCVRNTLLGVPVADVDLSTSARPDQVTAAAELVGLKAIPTGIDHGTITVVSGGIPHEVTTFRRDVATDGRRAVVAFADTIKEDALRRDFTMNALYAQPDGTVEDPLGGLPDLQARRVRFIEDAAQRIREDYLRILRFFRFHAWYGDQSAGLDVDGLAACAANSDGLETLSKERVGTEMLKLLAAPDPAPAVAAMAQAGNLTRILPGADTSALAPLVHLEDRFAPDPIRRLAAIGGQAVPENLRLSKADARKLAQLREAATNTDPPAILGYRLGAEAATDAILVRHALLSEPLPNNLTDQIKRGAQAVFPIKAADLHEEGPALGAKLRALEASWIASDFTQSKAELLGESKD
nr:CCA tRNA nucleotidyltransferase [Candidatus Rhodobacter lobularis]